MLFFSKLETKHVGMVQSGCHHLSLNKTCSRHDSTENLPDIETTITHLLLVHAFCISVLSNEI